MKQTVMQELIEMLKEARSVSIESEDREQTYTNAIRLAESMLEKEKEQIGYTKKDVLRAGEMGEINHHDTKHIVSYLDEAKHYNETFNIKER